MAKVYLITSGIYSDYHVVKVTLDRDKAERYAMYMTAKTYNKYASEYNVEEFELDDFEVSDDIKLGYCYRYILNHLLELSRSNNSICIMDSDDDMSVDVLDEKYYITITIKLRKRDNEKAKKIFHDKLAELKSKNFPKTKKDNIYGC
jgi:hypothetical protein